MDWKKTDLGSIIKLVSGQHVKTDNYNENGEGIPYLTGPTDFEGDQIKPTKYTTQPKAKAEANDILLTVKGSGVGKLAYANRGYCISRQLMAIRPKYLEPKFLFYYLQFSGRYFEKYARGLIPGISRDEVNNLVIKVPPKPERDKIVEIIDFWSQAQRKLNHLIRTKRQYKKGLMQQLLSGKKRFPEFNDKEWVEVKIGDIVKEVERDVDWDDSAIYDLISVKRRSGGIIHRESLHGHEIKTKNLKTVKKDDFIISRMQVLHGASALASEEFEGTKVSGSYHTLVARNPDKFNIKYFNYLSQTPYLYHLAYISSHGVHIEKMTFKIDDYLKKKIKIPSTQEEQNKIVEVLDAAEKDILLLHDKLKAIKKQKKGLMQQLLTGNLKFSKKVSLP